jgi:hypothetical protein
VHFISIGRLIAFMRLKVRLVFVSVVVCCAPLLCFAQPDWVKSAVESAKHVSAPSFANSIILLDRTTYEYADARHAHLNVFSAVKILHTVDGSSLGAVSEVVGPDRTVSGLHGWLIQPAGKVEELGKQDILTTDISAAAGFYEDAKVLKAAFPDVGDNDVIAFSYEVDERESESMLNAFGFQQSAQVESTDVEIKVPEGWDLRFALHNADAMRAERPDIRTWKWSASALPARKAEPFMPPWHYVSPYVEFTVLPPQGKEDQYQFDTWRAVARWTAGVFAYPLNAKGDSVAVTAQRLVAGWTSSSDRLRALAHFVRDKIRYVALELGQGRFQPREPASTLANGYGDCKDKSALLCAMCRIAGIDAIPVLANATFAVDRMIPSPFQFNHCIVAVRPDSGLDASFPGVITHGWLFFDPTDEGTPLGLLPPPLLGNRVLMPLDIDSPLVRLPRVRSGEARQINSAVLNVTRSGAYSGSLKILELGKGSSWANESVAREKNLLESLEKRFVSSLPNASFSNLMHGLRSDTAWITVDVKGSGAVTPAGDYSLLKLDPFHASVSTAFTAPTRFFPVWLGAAEEIETDVRWVCSADINTEGMADSSADSCSSLAVASRTESAPGNTIHFMSKVSSNGTLLQPREYADIQRVWKSRCDVLGSTLLIK